MRMIVPFLFLTFVYLALSSNLELSNVILGIIIAVVILVLLRPPGHPIRWRRIPASLIGTVVYIIVLLFNTFRSGIQMARIIVLPSLPIKPGIVGIRSACKSELGRALTAHAISLPPGELFVEMDEDGTMYIHSLDVDLTVKQAKATQEYQRDILKKIFD